MAFRQNADYLFFGLDGRFEVSLISNSSVFVPPSLGYTNNFLQGLGNSICLGYVHFIAGLLANSALVVFKELSLRPSSLNEISMLFSRMVGRSLSFAQDREGLRRGWADRCDMDGVCCIRTTTASGNSIPHDGSALLVRGLGPPLPAVLDRPGVLVLRRGTGSGLESGGVKDTALPHPFRRQALFSQHSRASATISGVRSKPQRSSPGSARSRSIEAGPQPASNTVRAPAARKRPRTMSVCSGG